jgi:hypothetical protein
VEGIGLARTDESIVGEPRPLAALRIRVSSAVVGADAERDLDVARAELEGDELHVLAYRSWRLLGGEFPLRVESSRALERRPALSAERGDESVSPLS